MHPGRRRAARFRDRAAFQADPLWLHERNRTDGADQPVAQAFGFSIESDGPLRNLWAIAEAILEGRTNWTAFAIGAGTLAVILLLKNSKRVPGILIAVVGATVIVGVLDLAARADVSVLGPLPQGLPAFAVPWITYADIVPVLIGGGAVALVSFADTSVLSRAYAARMGTRVDPNQEMVGLGAANLAAGFFQGFPISSSSSRTPVAEAAGARTQLTGVVGALAVALLLLAAPNLLQHLPAAALAAVVIAAAIGLIEVDRSRPDLSHSALGVLAIDRLPRGRRRSRRHPGHRPGDRRSPSSSSCGTAGVRTPRCWDAPTGSRATTTSPAIPTPARYRAWCCFAGMRPCSSPTPNCSRNAFWRRRRNRPRQCAGWSLRQNLSPASTSPRPTRSLNWMQALHAAGIELCFAELKDPVKDKLKRFGLFEQIGERFFFPTIGAAVSSYLADHAVDWVDWKDRNPSNMGAEPP